MPLGLPGIKAKHQHSFQVPFWESSHLCICQFKMRLEWLSNIPAEIRTKIYQEFFASTSVYYKFDRQVVRDEEVRSAPWNLFLTAKHVKDEAQAMFWELSTFIFDHDFDIPLQWHLWPIQSLIVRGDLPARLMVALTTLVLQPELQSEQKKRLKYLNFERVLDTTYSKVVRSC